MLPHPRAHGEARGEIRGEIRSDRRGLVRGALAAGAVAGVGVLSGCSGADQSAPTEPSATGSGGTRAASQDPDERLVSTVLGQLARAVGELEEVRDAGPGRLGEVVDPLVRLHRAHGRLLGGLPDARTGRDRRGRVGAAAAQRRVATTEKRLDGQLTRAAVAARSGSLALTLASMAASVAQSRSTL